MSYNPFETKKSSRLEKEYLDIERPYSSEMHIPYYSKNYKPFYDL